MTSAMMTSQANSMVGLPGCATAPFQSVPECEIRIERCTEGCKIYCCCDDEVACQTLQNLCKMLRSGLCSCVCYYNGACVCQCNFVCGNCKCEFTADGCCITCTSGDKACCAMLQACCDAIACCCESGCCCYVCFNNTPVCCGTCA